MNARLSYLKANATAVTEDISAYRALNEAEYIAVTDKEELFRKSHFLGAFSEKIPVVIDDQERIVGSLRFWNARVRCRNVGHIIVDYRMILREGIPGIKAKIAKLKNSEANAFSEAVCAFGTYINRYAEKAETKGMTTQATVCRYLTENAPQTFHQALQLIWFVHVFLHAEGASAAVSFGRFDDYLYPFYKRDLENGTLTREDAKELLSCFWLKTCEGDESQNLTVGGDIENDLTFLCLEVATELKVQQPSISVRLCENTSDELWESTLRLVKQKIGLPAIFNDSVIIPALQNAHVDPIDAKNYAIVGCYEANSDGNTLGTTANAGEFYLHDVLLEFLAQEGTYDTFPAFYEAFKHFFKEYYNNHLLVGFQKRWQFIREKYVSPFESLCFTHCLENGIPAEWGGCKYTMAGLNILGIGTLTDSLYTIKRLVFEEAVYEYPAFIHQVLHNFPDRSISQRCKNLNGKYGTDSAETNALARELSLFIADLVENGNIHDGVIPYAGLFVFLGDVHSAKHRATPDGRLEGERLSYGVGASDFCSNKTLTTLLNSAANIANDHFANGNPLMFSIPEKEVAGEKGNALLKALIKGYFAKGGFHLQINVTDAETLKKAKETPDNYRDLIVRISGYSEYFTKLQNDVQDALIERS